MSTAWWASAVRSEDDWAKFDEAVDDIQWVISQVAGSSAGPPALAQLAPPKTPQEPEPSKGRGARSEGKRQTKMPTRYLN